MPRKRIVLTFPSALVGHPITYHLIKDHNLLVNILRANVTPKEQGRLVIEMKGTKVDLESGLKYLSEIGVNTEPLAQDVKWYKDRCIECSACISVCPSGAFVIDRKDMSISFKKEKCIACGLCIPVCPYDAVDILF